MSKMLIKDTFRSIRANKLRFISIILIVALGFSFFVGIKSSAPQMRDNANEYFKNNNIADIRLTSAVGFTDNDLQKIASANMVKYAVMSKYVDTLLMSNDKYLADSSGEKLSCRVGTIDFSKAQQFTSTKQCDDSYMNRLVLYDGRYPQNENECVIDVNVSEKYPSLSIGKTITVTGDGTTLEEALFCTEFLIVGTVKSPLYISDNYTDTTVSNGTLGTFMYVCDEAFSMSASNEIFIKAVGSDYLDKFSDDYNELVTELTKQVHSFSDISIDENSEKIGLDLSKKAENKNAEITAYNAEAENLIKNKNAEITVAKNDVAVKNEAIKKLDTDYNNSKVKFDAELTSISTQLNAVNQELDNLSKQRDSVCAGVEGYSELKEEYDNLNSKHTANEATLTAKQKEYNSAQTDLDNKKSAVTSLENKIEACKNKITNAEAEINTVDSTLPDYNTTKNSLTNQREHISSQIASLKSSGGSAKSLSNAQNELAKIDAQLATVNSKINELNTKKTNAQNTISECKTNITEYSTKLATANSDVTAAQSKFNAVNSEYTSLKESFEEETEKISTVHNSIIELTKNKGDIDKINSEIEAKSSQQSKLKIKYAETVVSSALLSENYKNDKDNANYNYKKAQINYLEKSDELDELKLSTEKRKNDLNGDLKYLTATLENLSEISWSATPLNKQQGFVTFLSAMENIRYTAYVFPLIFFVISMLSCFVIMVKNVEDDRQKIGIFKALGYSNTAIIKKYLFYSVLAWIFGIAIGFPVGTNVLPKLIYSIYKSVFTIPEIGNVYNPWYLFYGLAASILTVAVATFSAIVRQIRYNPANLMLPSSRGFKKHSFIEYIPGLWEKLSYGMIIAARAITRSRKRVILSVTGIMLCTALVLTSFGLLNSAKSVTSNQYGNGAIFKFDAQITTNEYNEKLLGSVVEDDRIDSAVYISKSTVNISYNGSLSGSVNMIVPTDSDSFDKFIDTGNTNLTDDEIIITQGVADKLKIKVGDAISVVDANGADYSVKVTSICENYINDFLYLSSATYQGIFNEKPQYSVILCKAKDYVEQEKIDEFTVEYSDNEDVVAVSSAKNLASAQKISIDRVGILMILFIVCASIYSFIVIYTVSNLSLSQQIHEIANIKVIGFSDHEALIYVMREINISIFAGLPLGIVLGVILHRLFISFIRVDNIIYSGGISWWSFAATIAIIALITMISALPIRIKIKKINMAETLKSILHNQ